MKVAQSVFKMASFEMNTNKCELLVTRKRKNCVGLVILRYLNGFVLKSNGFKKIMLKGL